MPWHDQQAAKIAVLEQFDGFADLRNNLRQLAAARDEWAGIPMLLEDHQLVIEPGYPNADKLMEFGAVAREDDEMARAKMRNCFWSWTRRTEIAVWELDGKIEWGPLAPPQQTGLLLKTLHAADAWGIEQEHNAVDRLGTLVRHRQFKQYLLTGMFMEQSRRSGVHYLFRRLRPTIAMTERPYLRFLCALCLHPIGYYAGSWAGAMTPTDEVVAHLMLMRGDEPMFWRRANQHPSWVREAGI